MKHTIYFLLLLLFAGANTNAQQGIHTVTPTSASGKKFVYYSNINSPPPHKRDQKLNKDGSITVDMGQEVIELSTMWIEFFDGKGFVLPPVNSKFFTELIADGKKDSIQITRYSDTIIKAKCTVKIEICTNNDNSTEDEFILNALFKKHLGIELRYSFYGRDNSSIRAIWEVKSSQNLTVISTDKTIDPSIDMEIEDNGQELKLLYQIKYKVDKKVFVELCSILKTVGEPKLVKCEFFDLSIKQKVTNQKSQLKSHFGEFITDLPGVAKQFFTTSILKELEVYGR